MQTNQVTLVCVCVSVSVCVCSCVCVCVRVCVYVCVCVLGAIWWIILPPLYVLTLPRKPGLLPLHFRRLLCQVCDWPIFEPITDQKNVEVIFD